MAGDPSAVGERPPRPFSGNGGGNGNGNDYGGNGDDDVDDGLYATWLGLSGEGSVLVGPPLPSLVPSALAPPHDRLAVAYEYRYEAERRRARRMPRRSPLDRLRRCAHRCRYRRSWPRREAGHRAFVALQILSVGSSVRLIMAQLMPIAVLDLTRLQIFLRLYMSVYCGLFIVAEMGWPMPAWAVGGGAGAGAGAEAGGGDGNGNGNGNGNGAGGARWGGGARGASSSNVAIAARGRGRLYILPSFLSRGFAFTFVATVGLVQGSSDQLEEALGRARRHAPGAMPGASFFLAILVQLSSWLLMVAGIIYILLGAFCMKGARDRCREEYRQRVETFLKERREEASAKAEARASARVSAKARTEQEPSRGSEQNDTNENNDDDDDDDDVAAARLEHGMSSSSSDE